MLSDVRSEAALLAVVTKFINWMLPRAKVRHREPFPNLVKFSLV